MTDILVIKEMALKVTLRTFILSLQNHSFIDLLYFTLMHIGMHFLIYFAACLRVDLLLDNAGLVNNILYL